MTAHILIAEDEVKIASLLADYLHAAGMQTTIVADGARVVATVAEVQPDLLILDIMLPNRDGKTICRELRAAGDLPIIMLTALGEEIDRLIGLELGADDYVCKPFSAREVVARVKAILRRSAREPLEDTSVPRLDIDEQRMRVNLNGRRLDLTPIEFKLLSILARHPGRVYRRDELLDLLYDDYRDVSDRTVDSHIKNLRRKVGEAEPERQIVHSVYGVGYKLELD